MSFRFVKISGFYPDFLKSYYAANSTITSKPYSVQYEHLMAQGFGWSDYLCVHLRKQGVDAHEIVCNADPLNQAWARENGLSCMGDELFFERVKRLKPDVLFIQDTGRISHLWLKRLRAEVPSIRVTLGWRCSPFVDSELDYFRSFDLMLTCTPAIYKDFTERGLNSGLLYHGFEESLVSRLGQGPKQDPSGRDYSSDVLFAGSLVQAKGYHQGRTRFLSTLVNSGVPLTIRADMAPPSKLLAKSMMGGIATTLSKLGFPKQFESTRLFSRALQWQEIKPFDREQRLLRARCQAPAYGLGLYELLHRAKICINFHIDFAGEYAGNARIFEATGAGSCLLTDQKHNMGDLFQSDQEVVTYNGVADCVDKIRWLLNSPNDRRRIAEAGQKRCLKSHSLEVRAGELHDMIRERL